MANTGAWLGWLCRQNSAAEEQEKAISLSEETPGCVEMGVGLYLSEGEKLMGKEKQTPKWGLNIQRDLSMLSVCLRMGLAGYNIEQEHSTLFLQVLA